MSRLKLRESARLAKSVKQITFDGFWGKLEAKWYFLRQPFRKYMRSNQVFM